MKKPYALAFVTLVVLLAQVGCSADSVLDKQVTCTFKKPVADVFADLGKQAGIKIKIDKAVTGQVEISLGQTTLKAAVEEICRQTNSYPSLLPDGSMLIGCNLSAPYWLLRTEVIPVGHLDVSQIMEELSKNPIFPYLTVDKAANTICITAPESLMEIGKAAIKELDKPQYQVRIEASVLETSSDDTKDRSAQMQLQLGPQDNSGLWTFSFGGSTYGASTMANANQLFTFNYLNSKGLLKTLAQPSLTVQDCKPAFVDFGGIVNAVVAPGVSGSQASVQQINAGISLKVLPRVILDSLGKPMSILMDVDAVDADPGNAGTGTTAVTTINREAKTTVVVKNGETIILGGLKTSEEVKVKTRVPILSSIPLLGGLFRSSHLERDDQRVTILITAHVVEQEEMTAELQPVKEEIQEREPRIAEGVPSLNPIPTPVSTPTQTPAAAPTPSASAMANASATPSAQH